MVEVVIFLSGCAVVAAVGVINLHRVLKKPKRSYGIWVPEATKGDLTARQRSDLYQDMDWWDREFRKLSGVPEPVDVNGLVGSMAQLAESIQKAMEYKAPTDAELLTKYGSPSYTYNAITHKNRERDYD